MRIEVLKKGDSVLAVTNEFIAIERKSGEVDIVPFVRDGKLIRIDKENMVTIGYGDDVVTYETENGVQITMF